MQTKLIYVNNMDGDSPIINLPSFWRKRKVSLIPGSLVTDLIHNLAHLICQHALIYLPLLIWGQRYGQFDTEIFNKMNIPATYSDFNIIQLETISLPYGGLLKWAKMNVSCFLFLYQHMFFCSEERLWNNLVTDHTKLFI